MAEESTIIIKDIGAGSAYAMAVEGGYTGTEEQFKHDMAYFADNIAKVEQNKNIAAESADNAQASESHIVELELSVQNAKTDAMATLDRTIAAKDASVIAQNHAAESASLAQDSETNAKSSETNAKISETNAKTSEANAAESAKSIPDMQDKLDKMRDDVDNYIASDGDGEDVEIPSWIAFLQLKEEVEALRQTVAGLVDAQNQA